MPARLEYWKSAPQGLAEFRRLQAYVEDCGLERSLLELVKTRASQINGCAYCIDMHAKDARAGGETEERLSALSVWRETPFFSERERAALAWTEAITCISASCATSGWEWDEFETKETAMSEGMYPTSIRELARRRRELTPETEAAFQAFSQKAFADGALPAKTKQIIAVAVAHVTQCPYCIKGHTRAALRHGATEQELMEAIWVAAEMRAGGAYAHSVLALDEAAKTAGNRA